MPSARLETYLRTLTRQPAITDPQAVRQRLTESGVPLFDPVVHFQCTYGGYVQPYGAEQFVWGLLHETPHPYADFLPNLPTYELDNSGRHNFECCNCHGSDSWTLDETGLLYWCDYPVASSFEKKLEGDAIIWELGNVHESIVRVNFTQPNSEILALLLPRLSEGLISEASDEFGSVYNLQNIYATVEDDEITCSILGGTSSGLLDGLAYETRSLALSKQKKSTGLFAWIESLFNRRVT